MRQGLSRRFLGSFLLGTMATVMAACGVASGPSPSALSLSTIQARRPAPARPMRFGMRFDAQTPRVRYVPGTINTGLPASVDLRSKLSPIDDQGQLNSCTGFAITGLAEFRAKAAGKPQELSPGFIYVLELKDEGRLGQDTGTRISTGMKILQSTGIAPEGVHPYLTPAEQKDGAKINAYLTVVPGPAAMKAAAPHRVKTIAPIEDLLAFKTALAHGNPVVFGMACYSSMDSDEVKKSGTVPLPDQSREGFLGGHAILAVGYDEAKQVIHFRNSYSPTWGNKGYGTLPYSYFNKELVGDAWQAN